MERNKLPRKICDGFMRSNPSFCANCKREFFALFGDNAISVNMFTCGRANYTYISSALLVTGMSGTINPNENVLFTQEHFVKYEEKIRYLMMGLMPLRS